MVPIFEEHATRIENGFSIEDWYKLESIERAMIVAMRRIDVASKNLQAEAEIKASKRNSKRG